MPKFHMTCKNTKTVEISTVFFVIYIFVFLFKLKYESLFVDFRLSLETKYSN